MAALFNQLSGGVVLHEIKNAECLSTLQNIEAGKFDLILSSLPYNVGKEYETKTSIEKYLESQEPVIDELVRTLSGKGNLADRSVTM